MSPHRGIGQVPQALPLGLHKTSSDLLVRSEAYVCLFFRQNGGDSLLQEEENPNPQLFHIALWIWEKKPFITNFFRQRFDPPSLKSQIEDATL
jgi:hypothetical protein